MMNSFNKKLSPLLSAAGLTCILFLLILLILDTNPVLLRSTAIALRFSFSLVFPALILVFVAVLFLPGHWGKWTASVIISMVFSIVLLGVWASGITDNYILSGMLPLADASDYYTNALHFPQTGLFSSFSSRRPIFNSVLVGLVFLADNDLILVQSLLTILTALCCAFTLVQLLDFLHPAAVSLLTVTIFFYFRRFAGVISSEILGIALGMAGFLLLWRSILRKEMLFYCLGLFLSSLALFTRAGAFVILPMLVLWGTFYLRQKEMNVVHFVLLSLLPLVAAYLVNKLLFNVYGAADGTAFSNYAYSLYGLAKGGASWVQIFEDHPELTTLPINEQTSKAYQLALQLIFSKPVDFLSGILHEWGVFFSESYSSIWSFISPHPLQATGRNIPMILSHAGLYLLSLAGILRFIKNPKCAHSAFAVFSFIGFLLSVPLAPPSHAYGLRVFAASIWVLGLLPAIGLNSLIPQKWQKAVNQQNNPALQMHLPALFLNSTIILLIVLGPVLAYPSPTALALPVENFCGQQGTLIFVPYHPRSTVAIEREDAFFLDGRSRYHQGRFMRNLHDIAALEYSNDFKLFDAPFVILPAVLLQSSDSAYLVFKPEELPDEQGNYLACAQKRGVGNVYAFSEWILP